MMNGGRAARARSGVGVNNLPRYAISDFAAVIEIDRCMRWQVSKILPQKNRSKNADVAV